MRSAMCTKRSAGMRRQGRMGHADVQEMWCRKAPLAAFLLSVPFGVGPSVRGRERRRRGRGVRTAWVDQARTHGSCPAGAAYARLIRFCWRGVQAGGRAGPGGEAGLLSSTHGRVDVVEPFSAGQQPCSGLRGGTRADTGKRHPQTPSAGGLPRPDERTGAHRLRCRFIPRRPFPRLQGGTVQIGGGHAGRAEDDIAEFFGHRHKQLHIQLGLRRGPVKWRARPGPIEAADRIVILEVRLEEAQLINAEYRRAAASVNPTAAA